MPKYTLKTAFSKHGTDSSLQSEPRPISLTLHKNQFKMGQTLKSELQLKALETQGKQSNKDSLERTPRAQEKAPKLQMGPHKIKRSLQSKGKPTECTQLTVHWEIPTKNIMKIFLKEIETVNKFFDVHYHS